MGKYTQEEETKIVYDAMLLTAASQEICNELVHQRSTTFDMQMPQQPTLRNVEKKPIIKNEVPIELPVPPSTPVPPDDIFNNPQINCETTLAALEARRKETKQKYNRMLLIAVSAAFILPCFLGMITMSAFLVLLTPVFAIAALIAVLRQKSQEIEKIDREIKAVSQRAQAAKDAAIQRWQNSEEYKDQVDRGMADYQERIAKAKEKNEAAQRAEDERYERLCKEEEERFANETAKAKQEYLNDLESYEQKLITYKDSLAKWESKKKDKTAVLLEELQVNLDALNALHEETRIISQSYRELWILCWLHSDMSTSDHDIRYATELLDRDRQRALTIDNSTRTSEVIGELRSDIQVSTVAMVNEIDRGNRTLEGILGEIELGNDSLEQVSGSLEEVNEGLDAIGKTTRSTRRFAIGNTALNLIQTHYLRKGDKRAIESQKLLR